MRMCVMISPWRSSVIFGGPWGMCGAGAGAGAADSGLNLAGNAGSNDAGAGAEIGFTRVMKVVWFAAAGVPGTNGTKAAVIIPVSCR